MTRRRSRPTSRSIDGSWHIGGKCSRCQCLELTYEHVVADLETEARRLVAACGLEWEPACLAFHQTRRAVHTASFSQVRQPIYSRSVGRWRHYADAGALVRPARS